MQEFEIEFEPTAKEFEIDISNKVREVTPSLIDLEVTPSKEEQIFTHDGEFGYDNVKVNATPLQEKEIVPSKGVIEVVPDEDYLALEKVTVNSIPEEYTIPEGTIEIIRNGVYDVKDYVNADVRTSGIDPDEYQGFAFGLGLERITLLKYEIDDMRLLYENDDRFLSQF